MIALVPRLCSGWPYRKGCSGANEAEHRESGEVHRRGEKGEVGADLGPAADAGPSAAVATAHEVADLAFDLRPGGPVVGPPGRIALGRPGPDEQGFMGSNGDRPATCTC